MAAAAAHLLPLRLLRGGGDVVGSADPRLAAPRRGAPDDAHRAARRPGPLRRADGPADGRPRAGEGRGVHGIGSGRGRADDSGGGSRRAAVVRRDHGGAACALARPRRSLAAALRALEQRGLGRPSAGGTRRAERRRRAAAAGGGGGAGRDGADGSCGRQRPDGARSRRVVRPRRGCRPGGRGHRERRRDCQDFARLMTCG
mmetsp:Transcript_33765/g.108499  ORF Transcript_33765/g.108499 Transcript_33765/m.108499 type:complete len:201 (+) Transcript_33765:169-771(+)